MQITAVLCSSHGGKLDSPDTYMDIKAVSNDKQIDCLTSYMMTIKLKTDQWPGIKFDVLIIVKQSTAIVLQLPQIYNTE